ncbi:hypothetical protein DSECCO2_151090 [anaerobic digester metagenome]
MKSQWENYNKNLLEYLTVITQNNYISNLFYDTPFLVLSRAIASIPADAFTVAQWEEAANYLLREKISFSSSQQAIHYLSVLGWSVSVTPYNLYEDRTNFIGKAWHNKKNTI